MTSIWQMLADKYGKKKPTGKRKAEAEDAGEAGEAKPASTSSVLDEVKRS